MYGIAILMILDYALTYIGIKAGVIIEANPLMTWIFKLNFVHGLAARCFIVTLILLLFKYIRNRNKKAYVGLLRLAAAIYLLVLILHVNWLLITINR